MLARFRPESVRTLWQEDRTQIQDSNSQDKTQKRLYC